jgi:hypothetical protein
MDPYLSFEEQAAARWQAAQTKPSPHWVVPLTEEEEDN